MNAVIHRDLKSPNILLDTKPKGPWHKTQDCKGRLLRVWHGGFAGSPVGVWRCRDQSHGGADMSYRTEGSRLVRHATIGAV
eukprot:COSAG04_NODE_389_length_15213_cov_44.128292_14_plen_81_part_00